jgi:ppGpp synthetase/RelA/SpoT-type nucleotidyltranferase
VTSRLKDRDQLEDKLRREGKHYKQLSDVTDIAGVRIITHFEDEVDKIGTLVEREFGVDPGRSIDKRKVLDPDRFGYLSLHYICGLHADRLKLSENRKYGRISCEVQIRSILQHAWAEIEHDLGYKPNSTVPAPVRRRFCRLAGLLEIADQEFESIRDELGRYSARVEEEIKAQPSQVEIDHVSLEAFVRTDSVCKGLDEAMALWLRVPLVPANDFQPDANYLRYAGIISIEELRRALLADKDLILCQFKRRLPDRSHGISSLARGICLLHLVQVILARKGSLPLTDFFSKFNFGGDEEKVEQVVVVIAECSEASS